jgi:predicted acyltransferase
MSREVSKSERIFSVDALRGAAILAIIGADGLASALEEMARGSEHALAIIARFLGTHFSHSQWEGFRFYDLVFPLFLFTVGFSIPLSLTKARGADVRTSALARVVRRSVLLFLLGIVYYWTWNST